MHAMTVQSPYVFFFASYRSHFDIVDGFHIGGVEYDEYIGLTYIYDEDGNVYNTRLEDPHDLYLYLPNHIYTIKEMMAQIDIIVANDPNAVIIVQADHGIHGIGPTLRGYSSEYMSKRGYSLEEQLYMNMSTISAVRIPPQYGELTQPLDPLDIARYLVNNFVGAGNYEYLYYMEEAS
jgi:hypothetical protein